VDSPQDRAGRVGAAGCALSVVRSRPGGHIAILSANFSPEPTGSGVVIGEFASFLANGGLDVRVATSFPYYPHWRIYPGYRGRLWATERDGRMTVFRSWLFVSPRVSTVSRILTEITLSLLALPNIVRALRGARAAYILTPALSYAFVGSVLAWLLGVPRHLIVHDVMPDTAVELGMMRNPVLIAVSRWLARVVYALAREIQTLGDGMRRRIARGTRRPDKIRIVPITIDASELAPVAPDQNQFRRRFVGSGRFAVLYTGNIGWKQDLDILLRAAARLRHEPEVHFYVFGEGSAKDQFMRRRAELELDNVSHYPLQERSMLPHMLSGADIVLVSQMPQVVDIVVPSKLLTALGAGAMVVAACAPDSETAEVIRASSGGLLIGAGDDLGFVRAILTVYRGEVDVASFRGRARAYALSHLDRRAVYGPIMRALRGLVAAPTSDREPIPSL
jgi:colanic acid biosynthesis glycosyl transferase WcaI